MKKQFVVTLFLLLVVLLLAACNAAPGSEPAAPQPTTAVAEPTVAADQPDTAEPENEAADTETCAAPQPGTYQLIDAAHGICFLYPDNYEVFQGDDGSLTLYVDSLQNTEAPLATIHFATLDGRTIQEVVPDYPSDAELAAMSVLSIELGEEMAPVFDTIPGQDTNRRVIAVHDDRVYDLMVARIGEDYGAVGEEAEALFDLITSSWEFIDVVPDAPLQSGSQ
ncbi:MAG: hypothetical protein H6659_13935 [Ardenticatenaceae bacterium]|nr:hypothetical protein [Ardenticatenaceae bacterium]MCB8987819.1 hypothetical protein [Ardenticatenaceae bacterium]